MDILFFMAVPVFFYLFYQVLMRAENPLGVIQKFLLVFALYVAIPPFVELITGIQFVSASDELAIKEGSLKGLFFNPNNLAATAVCLAPAILFFFQLQGRKHKEKLLGWGLYLLLGMAIFVCVSRTAIACYLLISLIYIAYRKNGFITVIATGLLALTLSMIPSRVIAEFLLSLNGNPFLERFSSRVYLFLFDLDSDNSVSYRQEIYNYFWNNPPLLLTGYGPKNFRDYFGGHLSNSLGFENPHSFIIELYLGFGIISLLGFIAFVAFYFLYTASSRALTNKSRVLAWVTLGIFLLAGFIPSTILRMPFIWLPCLLIYIYSTFVASKLQNQAAYTYSYTPSKTKGIS
nr:O-antigen ligase domain-containing protein [Neisseria perflava]